ncbi:MAG: LysR family transcriptional regulator, partial [Acinetobacter guillouiae]
FELPFSVKPFNVSANWYNHRDDIEARTWFIQTLQELFQSL